jgi:1-phosphatidylinositol phosphodiesterase
MDWKVLEYILQRGQIVKRMASPGNARMFMFGHMTGVYTVTVLCIDVQLTLLRYAIPSFLYIPEKVSLATEFLIPPDGVRPTLSIVYTSASSFPWAAPKTIAQGFGWPKWGLGVEGVNSRVGRWILEALSSTSGDNVEGEKYTEWNLSLSEHRLRGWVLMDFYDRPEHDLVELLVECNFRGRQPGEEGW